MIFRRYRKPTGEPFSALLGCQIATQWLLVSLLLLVIAGAVVRATGAGLGCPDWPFCWGCLIPPWKAEQIDPDKLDLEVFKLKAARLGRDVSQITKESILASFDPVHTWTEYVNRLISIPVGLFSLASLFFAVSLPRSVQWRWWIRLVALAGFAIILANAWMGRQIVYSGLKPGIITLHLALAMTLIILLVLGCWLAAGGPRNIRRSGKLFWTVALLLVLVVAEGIMGAQVREMTDELAKTHQGEKRSAWIAEIEQSPIYLVHRSFSWLIAAAAFLAYRFSKRQGSPDRWTTATLTLVLAMMVMGVILAHVAIFPAVQVLHVGSAAALLACVASWLLRVWP